MTSKVLGTSLRAIKDGNVATIALEEVDDGKMDEALRALLEQTAIVSSEEAVALTPVHEVVALENPHRFEPLSVEQIEAMLQAIEKKALAFDPRIVQVGYLGYEEAKGGREITNSLGVQLTDEDAVQYVACTIVALETASTKTRPKSGSYTMPDLTSTRLSERCARKRWENLARIRFLPGRVRSCLKRTR